MSTVLYRLGLLVLVFGGFLLIASTGAFATVGLVLMLLGAGVGAIGALSS